MSDEIRSFVEEARRAKLDELRAAGIEPFGYSFRRTFTAAAAVAAYDDAWASTVRSAVGRADRWSRRRDSAAG